MTVYKRPTSVHNLQLLCIVIGRSYCRLKRSPSLLDSAEGLANLLIQFGKPLPMRIENLYLGRVLGVLKAHHGPTPENIAGRRNLVIRDSMKRQTLGSTQFPGFPMAFQSPRTQVAKCRSKKARGDCVTKDRPATAVEQLGGSVDNACFTVQCTGG